MESDSQRKVLLIEDNENDHREISEALASADYVCVPEEGDSFRRARNAYRSAGHFNEEIRAGALGELSQLAKDVSAAVIDGEIGGSGDCEFGPGVYRAMGLEVPAVVFTRDPGMAGLASAIGKAGLDNAPVVRKRNYELLIETLNEIC